MIVKELNRNEYIFLSRMQKVSYVEIYKGEYQKLKVGDKILCTFENEEIEAYVDNLHYVLASKNIIDGMFFDEEKYGKLHVYLKTNYVKKDYSNFIEEYFQYKQLLSESKKVNFEILSRETPIDITRTKIVMPIKIVNPLLLENVLVELFRLPKRVLHYLMEQRLAIDTMDDEFVARKTIGLTDPNYLSGIDAIIYLYNKLESKHPLLKDEDIFINEVYIYPQYWERMYVEDGEENQIAFSYLSLVNRCKRIVLLKNNPECPKLILDNEKRMAYERCDYLLERFINDGLLMKRW